MTMILQQSATFERKSDGAIAIQCSVCFFSGFSTCHCSNNTTNAAQPQTQSSKSKKVSAANAASAAASILGSKKGPGSETNKNNIITTNSNEETHEDAEAAAKLRLGTLSSLINYLLNTTSTLM